METELTLTVSQPATLPHLLAREKTATEEKASTKRQVSLMSLASMGGTEGTRSCGYPIQLL